MDELAARRARRARVAGERRHPASLRLPVEPGDVNVILTDLLQIKGMAEELAAEALATRDTRITSPVGALVISVDRTIAAVRAAGGG